MVEQRIVELKCWWGPLQTQSASTKRSAEQKLQKKKLVGTLGDPKCKYKKVSGTKIGGDPQGPKGPHTKIFVPPFFVLLTF